MEKPSFVSTKLDLAVWVGFRNLAVRVGFRSMEKPSFANSAVRVGFRSSAVRVGFRVLKNGKIPKIRSGGLPKNGKPRNQDSFGWLLKPRFVRPFGFRWASEERKRTKILERINQRLGIEINSFALPESNCFGFLIPDDRIDYYSEMTFNIRSFQDVIM
ncbi:hypothetical protein RirG_235440 [Rhizophagus irregularis DAOM 197198w]|uniref:Uncharacterized protein n=1 Tax=Rhizophagus irregularis (strain DAOM 197198w) TaxID=1432141 RepID=A0A015IJQ9_RHIIW|nr:hypothetical protein RirG_235440 [Rhizophagus irregularis DAOM 197198w]